MWTKKRYLDELQRAEEKDERESKRLRGGQLIGPSKMLKLLSDGLNPFPTDHNPEAEIIYINSLTSGANYSANPSPEAGYVQALFDKSYNQVLIRRPADYHLAAVRCQFPMNNVPLFLYPLQSCRVTVGSILSLSGTAALWGVVRDYVTPLSINPASDLAPGQDANYPMGAIAIFNVQQFLDAINTSIQTCTQTFYTNSVTGDGFTFLPSPGVSPIVQFDESTQLFTIAFEEQAWYGGPDTQHYTAPIAGTWPLQYPLGTAFLFFNNSLYQRFFPQMPVEFTSSWTGFTSSTTLSPGGLYTDMTVCLRLNPYYELAITPDGGPQMSLVNGGFPPWGNGNTGAASPSPILVSWSYFRRYNAAPSPTTNTTSDLYWVNTASPHGLRAGDSVIVSGSTADSTMNGVYKIMDVGTNDPGLNLPTTNLANPPSLATTWHARKVTPSTPLSDNLVYNSSITMVAVTGSQLAGQLAYITGQVPEMSGWCNGVSSIRVNTFNIPIRDEYAPADISSSSGSLTTRRVIVDYAPLERTQSDGKMVSRAQNGYFSHDIYRWCEMISEIPLSRWSVYVVWVDQFGTEFPVYLPAGDLFEFKAVLRRKDIKF